MNPTARRVQRLLKLLFADVQQREASRQIGVTQSLLSRTLSEEREPSKTLLEKLASFPGVNPRWLLDGVGEPLLSDCTTLPVVTRLPKTAEAMWQETVSGDETYRISENQFSETRYWCRLTKTTVKSWGDWGQRHLRPKDGDYLLLETDPKQIESLPGQFRLVIVTHPKIAKGKPSWGILTSDMRFFAFKANTPRNQSAETGNAVARRTRRKITLPKGTAEMAADPALQVTKSDEVPSAIKIESEQVMAVVLEMASDTVLQKASD